MTKKVESRKAKVEKGMAAFVVFYFLLSPFSFAISTPTPVPFLNQTSTVRFVFKLAPAPLNAPVGWKPTSYDYGEKTGATYKLLGNTTKPQFDIKLIGRTARVFWVRPVVEKDGKKLYGVVSEAVFPGGMALSEVFVAVKLK